MDFKKIVIDSLVFSKQKKIIFGLFCSAFWIITSFFLFSCSNKGVEHFGQEETGLKVSKDGHSLLRDGKSFFWMGDTGWHLITQSPDDVAFYFKDRVNNHFNVIQMQVTRRPFNEPDFLPNYKGDLPFISLDPVKLNEQYFVHIDTIVKKAEKYNLVLAMVPTWGAVIDQIFSVDDPSKAYDFGYLLGKRYQDHKNVVWIVCGEYHKIAWDTKKKQADNNPDEREIKLIESLAQGLEAGHQGKNLMTIHPGGWKSSSEDFHQAKWMDFNMIQSYSIRKRTEFDILNDYERMPYKPTILAEPGYEYGGAGHTAFEVRYEAYHSVLNGGFGFTYGCEGIWNFKESWKTLLNSEGALQMKYLRALFESRPIITRMPASDIINENPGNWIKKTKSIAAISEDSTYAIVYYPNNTITLKIIVGRISGTKARAWWYNPRDGKVYNAENKQTQQPFDILDCDKEQVIAFSPPGDHGVKDWVLILDDTDSGYGEPLVNN